MDKEYLLLTGATGHLGQFLLRDLLHERRPVAVLVRSSRLASARQRVEQLLARFERQSGRLLPRPVVIEGDLRGPDLGTSDGWRRWLARHCGTVLHSAACVVFDRHTTPKRDVFLNNVQGTGHLLALCRDTDIGRFHYVSSAYSCGVRDRPVPEAPHPDGLTFRNDYEVSKHQAERLVRDCSWIDPPTIYRPSIVVGDLETGWVQGDPTIYSALQVMAMRPGDFRDPEAICRLIGLTGIETKNLVPVDWVSRVLLRLLEDPASAGQTYHLTNPHPTPVRQMAASFVRAVTDHTGTAAVDKGPSIQPLDVESLGERFASVFQPYFQDDPVFETAATAAAVPDEPCPGIGAEELHFLGAAYLGTSGKRPVASDPVPAVLSALHAAADETVAVVDAGGFVWEEAGAVALTLVGPQGGCWRLTETAAGASLTPGRAAAAALTVYAQAAAFADLVSGRLRVADALARGVLAAWSDDGQCNTARLEEVLDAVRAAAGTAGDGTAGESSGPLTASVGGRS